MVIAKLLMRRLRRRRKVHRLHKVLRSVVICRPSERHHVQQECRLLRHRVSTRAHGSVGRLELRQQIARGRRRINAEE